MPTKSNLMIFIICGCSWQLRLEKIYIHPQNCQAPYLIPSGIVLKALMANRLAAKKHFGYYIKMCHILITFSLPLSRKPQITLYLLKVLPSSDHQMSKGGGQKKNKKIVVTLLQPPTVYLPIPIGVKKATFLIFWGYFKMMFKPI